MLAFIAQLFDTTGFPARWNCGEWTPFHGWVHILSDAAIFGAYAAIPTSIAYYISRKKQDLQFTRLYWLFAAFIFSCGFVHLLEAIIFWQPVYRFSALIKVITAVVSWATVFVLVKHLPEAMNLPGTTKLNGELQQEIAERKKAEEEVRRLNVDLKNRVQELEALLNVMPIGIGIATDTECKTIKTNQAFAKLLRLGEKDNASLSAPTEQAPKNFRVLHQGTELKPEELPIQIAASKGVVITDFEEDIVFNDGEKRILLAYASPLMAENGKVRGAVGAFVDITDRKRAELERELVRNRLQESQRLESLGILAGGIAHDFNNLLTGIMGNAALAKMDVGSGTELNEHLDEIQSSSNRAADLCRQLLAYAGAGKFVMEAVDIGAIASDIVSLLRNSYPSRAHIQSEFEADLPAVMTDPSQMRQTIMNLLLNAMESMDPVKGGTVKISTRLVGWSNIVFTNAVIIPEKPQAEYVLLEVIDNGCGMDDQTKARMFDPFFTTKFVGRGLGLAAVLGIVRSLGGAIDVSSTRGGGTTFRIYLPSSGQKAGKTSQLRFMAGTEFSLEKTGTILIVDDEETVRDVCRKSLSDAGFKVLVANDGVHALEIFRENKEFITAVVLDLSMPRMDGQQTFSALRMIVPRIKVLMTSGFSEEEMMNRLGGKTPAGFIQKPYMPGALVAKVRQILSSK
jgi:two-component system cell cycle sensor histidine kinase/response regulator CckA